MIRKAVFPVAGLGTRMLPATKAIPKEMLPVVDKPIIQYAFEEARAAGIEHIIFVTGRGKSVIEDHFDRAYELDDALVKKGKLAELDSVSSWVPLPGELSYTRQQEPLGLGHAVWCARELVGNEPFAVVLVDDLIRSEVPCLEQMVAAHSE
ncbi:MAG TPA: sugar phosphate nucleotidyltransferase, partial [Geminicoccaceae bacterium]|nr:sugar phosphate nucleotidyltransferase [Geminicoccaceae bacterium]